jgi:hypothetical protein
MTDLYFTDEYCKLCEYSDNVSFEIFKFEDLIYPYLKRPYRHNNIIYYDIISPYGYSGLYFKKHKTYDRFLKAFSEHAIKNNFLTEVIKQSPYILEDNLEDKINYEIIKSKKIFGIRVDDFDYYFKKVLGKKQRNIFKKGAKIGLTFSYSKIKKGTLSENSLFRKMYEKTMNKVNADKYYYFNNEYFSWLEDMECSYLAVCKNDKNICVGFSIIFDYGKYVHYHLSCNDQSSNCITEFLIINIVKEICINKLFILGGGVSDNDNLEKFKSKLCNETFTYNIYKNILNTVIYDKINKNNDSAYFPAHQNV